MLGSTGNMAMDTDRPEGAQLEPGAQAPKGPNLACQTGSSIKCGHRVPRLPEHLSWPMGGREGGILCQFFHYLVIVWGPWPNST